MKSPHRTLIASPALDFELAVEDHGEHHMSCWHIVFVLCPPIEGVGRIKTTNGEASLSPDGRFAILRDRVFLAVADLAGECVFHFEPGHMRAVADVQVEQGELRWISEPLRKGEGPTTAHAVRLENARLAEVMEPGWGRAADGRFPSAFGA